jgi:hypothetical protein
MEFIKPKEWPIDAAKKAYDKTYYIEAIQILHGWLENQARCYLHLIGTINFDADHKESYELSDTISFHDCVKVLRILNQITKEEFDRFNKFNSLRNKVIHNYFKEPYEENYEGIPKTEFDEIFNETLNEGLFFTRKNERIVG